jgi:hypothetical protein
MFVGKMKDFKILLKKEECERRGWDIKKWRYVSPSIIDDYRAINIETKEEFLLWSGSSGCNFSMVDKKGGVRSFLDKDNNIYMFKSKSKQRSYEN